MGKVFCCINSVYFKGPLHMLAITMQWWTNDDSIYVCLIFPFGLQNTAFERAI